MKKHKSDMDADRKKRGLPAFVPRPRSVNSLEPEERRKVTEDNDEDYEVTGLMCDSDGDCDCIDLGSRENTFSIFGDFGIGPDYEMICCVCELEEELTIDPTIHLDVSRVVLPPADDGRVAETHQVAELLITVLLYVLGMLYVLGADSRLRSYNTATRGPRFPTPWS